MNELDNFRPSEDSHQLLGRSNAFWESSNAASADLFQHMTSQLLALFRTQGCALPVAEELAQKVRGGLVPIFDTTS